MTNEWGFQPDAADALLPGDEATLAEWIAFCLAAGYPQGLLDHLEELADRHGHLYRVEYSCGDFMKYINSLCFAQETDEAAWTYWMEAV
jgi:hypothetical protein